MRRVIRNGITSFEVSLAKVPLEAVKYAAHSLTGRAHAWLSEVPGKAVRVGLRPKSASRPDDLKTLARDFEENLEMERIRSEIESNNRPVRELIIRRALLGEEAAPEQAPAAELTEEQQKELDRLIEEVEATLAKEPGEGQSSDDPLGVMTSWEDRHGKSGTGR